MSVIEEFSGIAVDDMLQLRKKKLLLFFDMLLHIYVLDTGLPSEFVVDGET